MPFVWRWPTHTTARRIESAVVHGETSWPRSPIDWRKIHLRRSRRDRIISELTKLKTVSSFSLPSVTQWVRAKHEAFRLGVFPCSHTRCNYYPPSTHQLPPHPHLLFHSHPAQGIVPTGWHNQPLRSPPDAHQVSRINTINRETNTINQSIGWKTGAPEGQLSLTQGFCLKFFIRLVKFALFLCVCVCVAIFPCVFVVWVKGMWHRDITSLWTDLRSEVGWILMSSLTLIAWCTNRFHLVSLRAEHLKPINWHLFAPRRADTFCFNQLLLVSRDVCYALKHTIWIQR